MLVYELVNWLHAIRFGVIEWFFADDILRHNHMRLYKRLYGVVSDFIDTVMDLLGNVFKSLRMRYRALQEVLGAYHKFTLTSTSNFGIRSTNRKAKV